MRRRFLALFALGMIGVVSLGPAIAPLIARTPLPAGAPQLPLAVTVALSLIQPTLLLAIGVAIGVRLAPRLGLRSYVVDSVEGVGAIWPRLRPEVPIAAALAAGQMAITLALEYAFRPLMGDAWRRLEAGPDPLGSPLTALVAGLFYGGITEELMIRWGLMTLLAWGAARIVRQRSDGPPRPAIMWTAIVVSAVLFGVGHLPAVSALVPLTPFIAFRTVLLNTIAGAAFGWLFWRRSLEAAMVAHATSHIILFVVKLATR